MKNKFTIGFFAIAILVAGIGELVASRNQSVPVFVQPPAAIATTTPPTMTPPQTATSTIPDSSMHLFPFKSLDGGYVFNLYVPKSGVGCIYRVVDNEGHEVSLDNVVGSYNINCSVGLGFDTDFIGWASGDKFLLRGNPGEIKIVDVKNLAVESHQYNASSYYFDAASRSLQYWLYQHDEGGGDYTILDTKNNIILANIHGYWSALYEPVNDGFIFSAIDPVTSSTASLRLDYLPASTLKLRSVFKSNPFPLAQRGSESPSVSGKPGELMYSSGIAGLPSFQIKL
jgi:hypothetical protein